jgi:hypothetical protein
MKKLVFAFVMALASMSLVYAPTLRAQDISVKDPVEFKAYSDATTQSDPKAKAAALESFLTTYPQSVVKKLALDILLDTYQQLGDGDHALSAASRLLQVDPGNFKATLISVAIKKSQCQKAEDPKTGVATDPAPCDDAAALAQTGLKAAKPTETSADDWKKQTAVAFPIFDSAIALDDAASKKDLKAAEDEYAAELMLYTDDQSKTAGLQDTLLLAQAYGAPGPGHDLIKAVWFYARVWDFAPPAYKARIEPTLEYLYSKYHGGLDGLDAIKTQAATTTFPPGTLTITPADTPAQKIHKILDTTPDLNTLALADKELVLAFGEKADADKLWALMKDKDTPVPGIVVEATASVIKVAVTDDAKNAKPMVADFIVNLKTPLADKDIPATGFEFGLSSKNQAELDGTYDSYTQIPGTDTVAQSAQIVLRDGTIVPAKKTPVHKPSAAHHTTASH